MSAIPACPQCTLENTYPDGDHFVCADCGHEWSATEAAGAEDEADAVVKDANGQVLADGDAVVLIKDLKVKGTSTVIKQGTVIKSIRLTEDPEEIDCRNDTIKGLVLRTEFVRKR